MDMQRKRIQRFLGSEVVSEPTWLPKGNDRLNSACGLRVCGLGRGAWLLGLAAVRERAR